MKFQLIITRIAALAAVLSSQLSAELPPQPQISFTEGSSGTWNADWSGVAGRTYFIQWSLDLIHWDYAPIIDFGENPEPYGIQTEGNSKFFIRLHYIDADWITTLQEAKDADFDGDKVNNYAELENGTNPFLALDTDGDGMPDDWETAHGFDPNNPADAMLDYDLDGNSNAQEFQQNTDPKDYASRTLPLIAMYDGNEQVSSPSSRLPVAMAVRVTDSSGLTLSNVPIQFNVTSGGGLLARSPDDPQPASTLTLFSDENGLAGAFYIQPNTLNTPSSISATVTSGPDHSTVIFSTQTVASLISNDYFVGSSAESVGEFRFWQISKGMKQRSL